MSMFNLIGKIVEVEANGIMYTGRLVEVNETEIHLETESGWMVIGNDYISSLREVEE